MTWSFSDLLQDARGGAQLQAGQRTHASMYLTVYPAAMISDELH